MYDPKTNEVKVIIWNVPNVTWRHRLFNWTLKHSARLLCWAIDAKYREVRGREPNVEIDC